MPELPEVETVRTGLSQSITGARIAHVTVRRQGLRIPFPKNLAKTLEKKTISSIGRRAKYLLFYMDSDDVIIAHLGMSGRFSVLAEMPKHYEKHDHLALTLKDGRCVVFNDPRRFGLVTLTRAADIKQHALLSSLGPEPLSDDFSAPYLEKALKKRKIAIKPALMDQEIVVGVGNIYASEALFACGIDPRKPAHLAAKQASAMRVAIQKVLTLALQAGGSSLRDFVNISGDYGYFQHQFQVYDREGNPCFRCGAPIRMIRQSGRSTFFCAQCQK